MLCVTAFDAFDIDSMLGLAADQLCCTGCQTADICHAFDDHLALQMHVACLNGLLHLNSAYSPLPPVFMSDVCPLCVCSQASSYQRASASRSLAVCMISPFVPCMPPVAQKASLAAVRRCPHTAAGMPAGVMGAATRMQMLLRSSWLCNSQR